MSGKNNKQSTTAGRSLKQQQARKKQKNKWVIPAAAVGILAIVAIIVALQSGSSGNGDAISNTNGPQGTNGSDNVSVGSNGANGSQAISEGESLVIPVSEISETAQFYPVTVDGVNMEVIVVTAPDGTIRTAFNTCQVCNGSPRAYYEQRGNTLECVNCGNRFPMSSVEIEAGGCNPVPIFGDDKTVTDESITVSYETLQANAYRFPSNWKTG